MLNTTFFPKPLSTSLTYFRGDRRKYAENKVCLNRVSNSQSPVHEPMKTLWEREKLLLTSIFSSSQYVFFAPEKQISVFLSYLLFCLQMLSIWTSQKFCLLAQLVTNWSEIGVALS